MLTGETGAGKSLIAGALGLLAGGKAERDLIRGGEDVAWVEAVCDLSASARPAGGRPSGRVCALGDDGLLVLRRELRREGRGRVLINGLLSSLAVLEQIGGRSVAIQSQDQQRRAGRRRSPRDFLDDVAGPREPSARRWPAALEACRELEARAGGAPAGGATFADQQLDMWRYQQRELAGADLDADEEAGLAEAIAVGPHARALLEAAGSGRHDLAEGQVQRRPALGGRAAARPGRRHQRAPGRGRCDQLLGRRRGGRGAAAAWNGSSTGPELDPARLDELEERKALYEELRRKYRRDVAGLLALPEDLRRAPRTPGRRRRRPRGPGRGVAAGPATRLGRRGVGAAARARRQGRRGWRRGRRD